ncbi:MAG: hypothetical protein JW764_10350 [Chlorobiaceae bacterium]|nr:hypothetical protein [Chlorobiaceae bacterium]
MASALKPVRYSGSNNSQNLPEKEIGLKPIVFIGICNPGLKAGAILNAREQNVQRVKTLLNVLAAAIKGHL